MEQKIQRMLICDFLAALRAAVDGKRQASDGFREYAHTGIDRRRLHSSALVDRLARRRLPEQKGQAAEVIHGLISRTKEFAE